MILKMKILGAAKNCSVFPFRWGKPYFGSTLYPPPQNSLRLYTPLGRLRLLPQKSSKVEPFEKSLGYPKFSLDSPSFYQGLDFGSFHQTEPQTAQRGMEP